MTRTATLLCALTVIGSASENPLPKETENYWGDIDRFLDRQAEAILETIEEALSTFPPQHPEPLERRMALLMLDGVLHQENAASLPGVQRFHHDRIQLILQEMETTKVQKRAVLWKLYDHAFIVRTPTVTLAFDVTRGHTAGTEGFAISDETALSLTQQCDLLFISHAHEDHADDMVVESFLEQNKPVLCPPELWSDHPVSKHLIRPKREPHVVRSLSLGDDKADLQIVVYPGHQGASLPNNVTLVKTSEGITFCHTGDQSMDKDFEWIDHIHEHHKVDVLMPNCWTTDAARMVKGITPRLVLPGHENELGHSIDHREPYWLTYSRFRDSQTPFVVMTWGEAYRL